MTELQQMYVLIAFLSTGMLLGMLPEIIRKFKLRNEPDNVLVKDQKGQQHYVHESHILMVGFHAATECINCGGNSMTTEDIRKLILPCSMELSVYDGNSKFKHSTGETNV